MNFRKNFFVGALVLLCTGAFAQNKPEVQFYGFVRSFITDDSRLSKAGTADLYYYVPLDNDFNSKGEDLNAVGTSKYSALTSRFGINSKWSSEYINASAKIEADFYSGLSGLTGTATMRLRQAYVDLNTPVISVRVGQAWHPMAADLPDNIAIETCAPFGPFSRTPQVAHNVALGKNFTFTFAFLWQMQYTSSGPEGSSANYIKYSRRPERYIGFSYKSGPFLARIGGDALTIKPRYKGMVDGEMSFVDDKLTTYNAFMFLQYKKDLFSAKFKATYSQAGEHLNMLGGYGISSKEDDGHYEYTPTTTASTWASFAYGKKLKTTLFLGYAKCFGTKDNLIEAFPGASYADASSHYLAKNTYPNLNSTYRIAPCLSYNIGPITLACEYSYSAAQYGDYKSLSSVDALGETVKYSKCVGLNGLASENLHWVANHRLQIMVKYSF